MSQIHIEDNIRENIINYIYRVYATILNRHILEEILLLNPSYDSYITRQFDDIYNKAMLMNIPFYTEYIQTDQIERKLYCLSFLSASDIEYRIRRLGYTKSFHKHLVLFDEVTMKNIRNTVEDYINDNGVTDPILKYLKLNDASNIIKNQFKESISNPKFLLCRNRLVKELCELSTKTKHVHKIENDL